MVGFSCERTWLLSFLKVIGEHYSQVKGSDRYSGKRVPIYHVSHDNKNPIFCYISVVEFEIFCGLKGWGGFSLFTGICSDGEILLGMGWDSSYLEKSLTLYQSDPNGSLPQIFCWIPSCSIRDENFITKTFWSLKRAYL